MGDPQVTEAGPRQGRPSAADDPAATNDTSRDQRNARRRQMEVVTGIEHLPIGRARLSRVDVVHDECGHVHVHRLFETDSTTITRAPTCRPWRRYRIAVIASVPARVETQLRLGEVVSVPQPRRGSAAA